MNKKEKNSFLIEKILEKAKQKEINGKLFDGNGLAFFIQNFCEMINNKNILDFELLFGNLIYNDLHTFKNKSLKYFEDNIKELVNDNEEILIPKIYNIKSKSIEIYNYIQSLNYKVFNKPEYKEYKSTFISIRKELEKKFTELENKKLLENIKKTELICKELLNKHYETIHKKISNDEYNKQNTEEFIKDYTKFLNSYEKEAKGNNKIKILIEFLEINKPQYFNHLIYSKQKNIKENYDTFDNEENIEENKIKLNRKKREIENYKNEIKRIEDYIKKAQSLKIGDSSEQYKIIQ